MFSYTLKKNWILGPRNGEFGNNGNFVGVFLIPYHGYSSSCLRTQEKTPNIFISHRYIY